MLIADVRPAYNLTASAVSEKPPSGVFMVMLLQLLTSVLCAATMLDLPLTTIIRQDKFVGSFAGSATWVSDRFETTQSCSERQRSMSNVTVQLAYYLLSTKT
ncbi:hypothetical protein Rctr197k_144 [Virus Rctr197k]|nr:hypothetical protein Rctr197k_144 [Virus Rctr197k]